MNRKWKYLENQFLIVTNGNFKKAVKLSNYHDAVLKGKSLADTQLVPIYTRYHALHLALVQEYTSWKSAGGSQEGQTLRIEQMLEAAYGKMALWDITIQSTGADYMKGMPNYLAIFMDGRKPFTTHTIDSRVNAYDTLAKNMIPFPALAAVMADVEATFVALDEARDTQLAAKGIVKTGSANLEAARIEAMTMQWRNLGFAIDIFGDKPKYIESMFDLTTLRESPQRVFIGTVDPLENKAVLVHTFLADDQLRIKNKSNTALLFYLASEANGIDSTYYRAEPNTNVKIMASEFGTLDFTAHRYLTAVNESNNGTAHYEVEEL